MKHSILRSFETLIKGMDPDVEEPEPVEQPQAPKPPPKPRIVVEKGVFLGRAWRRYSDGCFEGETVRGMEAFRDLDQFEAFVEASPVLRSERAARDVPEFASEPDPAEAGEIEPVAVRKVAAAPATSPEPVEPLSVRPPAHTPADLERPRVLPGNIQLARNLMLAGTMGILLCLAWWLRFFLFDDLHGELVRRAIGEHAIGSTDLSALDRLGCLLLNGEPCAAVKYWGRFAGYVVYEPAFLWASACAVALGAMLARGRRAADAGPAE